MQRRGGGPTVRRGVEYGPFMAFILQNLAVVLLLIILLAISGIFSGAETVLLSLSKHDRVRMRKSKNPLEALAARLADDARSLLTSLLIGNMTCNILIFVLSALLLGHLETHANKILIAVLSVAPPLAVTYMSDVFPKLIGNVNNVRIAPLIAVPVATFVRIVWPFHRFVDYIVIRPIHRLIAVRAQSSLGRDEVRRMLEMSQAKGVIDVSENELLQEVVGIAEVKVRDVMTPRVDLVAYNIKQPIKSLRDLVRASLLGRIPVFENQIDNILGVVPAKRVFLDRIDNPNDVRKLIEPVPFVPETQTLDRLLMMFRGSRTQLALVVDEFGGLVGLVTLEDVVEQMVGEIYAAQEHERHAIAQLGDDTFMVPGDLSIVDWADAFGGPRELRNSRTIAGLLAQHLNRIPAVGDTIHLGNMQLTVTEMRRNRVQKVRLQLDADAESVIRREVVEKLQ
jgi:putative hemolysin